ncbi:Metal transporter Nramp1 [Acorus calamus]|uniref:Metal transporter Nramp1 n=1 Tax=Acorus calamus TaxID=4465 RepID=A0AAV9FBA2_ACOCL|nr:Metal transporter Nramp1 [Acorus calamus]
MAGCYFVELRYVKPPTSQVIRGLFILKLEGQGSLSWAPLSCSLVLSRKTPPSVKGINGFLDLKMKEWLRNLMTRCIAIVPSLVISIIGGSTGRLIIIALDRTVMLIDKSLGSNQIEMEKGAEE